MKSPCKNCKDRKLYCHSTCEKYLFFNHENEKRIERRSEDLFKNMVKLESVARSRKSLKF